jgi:O-antigen/teichoic acid export membrane protein
MFVLTLNAAGMIGGMGMGSAVIKNLSTARGSGNTVMVERIAGTAIFLALAGSLALAGVMIIVSLALAGSIFSKVGTFGDVLLLVTTAATLIAMEQLDGVYSGIMRAYERFELAARIEILAKLSTVVGMAALSAATGKLGPVIIFTIVATVLRLVTKAWLASKLIGPSLVVPRWDSQLASGVFHFGKWIWLQTIGGALFVAADRLIVGAMLGADALARYSICIQLAQQIHMLPSAGAQFIFPLVSRRMAEGTNVRRIAILGSLGVAVFVLCLALPILLFGDQILTLWVGPSIANDAKVTLRILAFAYLVLGLGVGAHFVLLGVGKVRLVAVNNIVAGLIAIGVSAYAVRYFGLEGAALSRVAYGIVVGQIIVTFYTSVKK